MATIVWETVSKYCARVGQEVELLEKRVYPADLLPDVGTPCRVLARKCSLGVDCNLAGYACRWSFINPGCDPFAET